MIDIPSTECLLSLTLRGFWWHPAAPSRVDNVASFFSRRTSPSAVSTWPTLCRRDGISPSKMVEL